MKERGKRTAADRRIEDVSFYYSTPSEFSCRKHPSVSPVGICPYCLNDRLVNLVCSECGEQRLSSCSCSDISPNRTSNATLDVVRMSSLIDEETTTKQRKETKSRIVFKRSSSSCVEIKRTSNHRFSKIGRFLRKINPKKERDLEDEKNNDTNDSWVLRRRVSRSRSLCSFRGGNGYFIGSEEDGSSYSGARSSFSAARSSSVNVGLCDTTTTEQHRKSNFSETEYPPRKSSFSETEYNWRGTENQPRRSNYEAAGRKSNFNEEQQQQQHRKSDSAAMNFTTRVLSVKESYFTGGEEPGFIDLKFDSSGGDVVINDGVLEHGGGGSCRFTKTKDRELSKSRRSFKGWKWIFGHHHHRDS